MQLPNQAQCSLVAHWLTFNLTGSLSLFLYHLALSLSSFCAAGHFYLLPRVLSFGVVDPLAAPVVCALL